MKKLNSVPWFYSVKSSGGVEDELEQHFNDLGLKEMFPECDEFSIDVIHMNSVFMGYEDIGGIKTSLYETIIQYNIYGK